MKRIKIFKAYFILWLFVYFIVVSNLEVFSEFFLSTLTFNVAIVAILSIGSFMIFQGSKELTMITGTFGVLMYKKKNLSKHMKGIEKIFPSNIANKIKSRVDKGVLLFTQSDKDEILTWIDEKFTNQNRYNNFFIGTVLMIGLLGTFTGLLGSIGSMAQIVSSLAGGDVDIGKIMAEFSGPLSSMAVGFGSSLFGVISAILLSIKGYLLNKAQATLLAGVENWLNSKTLEADEKSNTAVIPSNNLAAHQKSFMDVFVEQTGTLNAQMRELTHSNKEFKTAFLMTIEQVQKGYNQQKELLTSMKVSMDKISVSSNQNVKITQQYLSKLDNLNEENQRGFASILRAQQKSEKDNKMEFFQLLDSMEAMQKDVKKGVESLKKSDDKKYKSMKDYLHA